MAYKILERNTAVRSNTIQLKNQQDNVFVTITQKPDYIEAKWQGHITAEDVITAAKVYLDFVKKHRCPKLLNDKTDVTGDWEDANDWLEFEWLPQAIEAGLRFMAHVYSQNIFSRLSARDLIERVSPQLLMQNFYERQSAIDWLQHCPAQGNSRQLA